MNDLIVKPTFNGEIEAKIKSIGEIESNMQEVRTYAENLNEYYTKLIFDDDNMKLAKEEKAKVNKFKATVADYRKELVKQWKEPITQFETMAKETEQLLSNAYSTINIQCLRFDEDKKHKKELALREFFNEHIKAENIDFVMFEQVGLNITVTNTEKSLKEQIIAFIDKIKQDLQVIDSQENKAEILVEYKQTLNLNNSIIIVNQRKKKLQEEKERLERLEQERLEAQKKSTAETLQNFIPKEEVLIPKEKIVFVNNGDEEKYAEQVKQEDEEIVAPTNITEQEKTYTLSFKLTGTMEQLSKFKEYLKEYLKESGLKCE